MIFAIVNDSDGSIRQINEMLGNTDSLQSINDRLPDGQIVIECGTDVGFSHVYDSETEEFSVPE